MDFWENENEMPFSMQSVPAVTTNEDCSSYQIGCIATGTDGCMDAGMCSTLENNNQCDGKSTCQWTPQCVQNVNCSDLKTEILCKHVTLQNNKTCWWVNSIIKNIIYQLCLCGQNM